MKIIRLTITKHFFNLIASGEKKIEYRKISPYYTNLLSKAPEALKLHYYQREFLLVRVLKVTTISTPDFLNNSKYLGNLKKCYAIHLGEVILRSD